MNSVQVTAVNIVDMVSVFDRLVTTTLAVLVLMMLMNVTGSRSDLLSGVLCHDSLQFVFRWVT